MMIVMIKNRVLFILVSLLFCIPGAYAQNTNSRQWFSAELSYEPVKNLSFDLEQSWRIDEMSETSSTLTDLKTSFEIEDFRIGLGYRHTQSGGFIDANDFRHRFYGEINFRNKFSDLKLSLRSRLQNTYTDPFTSSDGLIPEKTWRNKIEFSYNLPGPVEPYISYEHFYLLRNERIRKYTDGHRFQAGIEYDFNKKTSLAIGYIYQFEVNKNKPDTDHILSVSFKYKIKN